MYGSYILDEDVAKEESLGYIRAKAAWTALPLDSMDLLGGFAAR